MRRIISGLVVAFLILIVAVTPLSATTQRGYYELWIPSRWPDVSSPHAILFDDTGLVRAFLPTVSERMDQGIEPTSGQTTNLSVSWLGGCGDRTITLHLYPTSGGYALDERTDSWGCQLLIGIGRQFTLLLYSPIDAATVHAVGADLTRHAAS